MKAAAQAVVGLSEGSWGVCARRYLWLKCLADFFNLVVDHLVHFSAHGWNFAHFRGDFPNQIFWQESKCFRYLRAAAPFRFDVRGIGYLANYREMARKCTIFIYLFNFLK